MEPDDGGLGSSGGAVVAALLIAVAVVGMVMTSRTGPTGPLVMHDSHAIVANPAPGQG
jgi:hypothetical protein